MRQHTLLRACSPIAILIGSCGVAHADAAPAGGSEIDPASPEIIVTAQKRAADASHVPIALSVFTGDILQKSGIVNVSSLSQLAPGLEVGSASHGPSITIRGVSATDVTSKGEQNVVFSLDGISIGRSQLTGLAFFDLERVEVLRGPQGTLYGKSATGGVINVITAKPVDHLDGSVSAEIGNYNTRRASAMINLPVAPGFAVRAAFNMNQRDGFLKPVLGGVSGAAEHKLGDENNWTARISEKLDLPGNGSLVVTETFGHIGGAGDANAAVYGRVLNGKGSDRFNVYYNPVVGDLGVDDKFANVNGELNFDVGPVRVTYAGGYQWWHGFDNFDPSVTDATITGSHSFNQYDSHLTTQSHELRLSNAQPGRLDWTVGANYIKESNDETDLNWQSVVSPTCKQPDFSAACTNPNPNIVGPTYHTAKGVFGQATIEVTGKLKLTGGLRYSKDDVQRFATVAAGPTPPGGWLGPNGGYCGPLGAVPCVGPTGPGGVSNDTGGNSTSRVTWRAEAKYQINPLLMIYGSVATGYKSGGFNDLDPNNPGHTGTYGAESVTAYELGLKGRIAPTLRVDSDVYYYNYSKYQLTGATFFTPNAAGGPPTVLIYTTLAPVTLYGWESTVNWTPTPNDKVDFSFALARGFFNGGPGQGTVGFIINTRVPWGGKDLDRLPRVAANISWEHDFKLKDDAEIALRVSSKISGSYKVSDLTGAGNPFAGVYFSLPQQYTQGSYTRTDASLRYTSASGKLTVEGFVRNIENKVQLQGAPQTLQPGWNDEARSVRINLPRTFGVRVGVKY